MNNIKCQLGQHHHLPFIFETHQTLTRWDGMKPKITPIDTSIERCECGDEIASQSYDNGGVMWDTTPELAREFIRKTEKINSK